MIQIRYTIRPFIKPNGQVAVRVRWNNNTSEVTFITGKYADKNKWDSDAHRAKKNTTHHVIPSKDFGADEINSAINDFKEAIEEAIAQYSLANSVPTASELKASVNNYLDRTEQKATKIKKSKKNGTPKYTMNELLQQFLQSMAEEKNWKDNCREKYVQAFQHLMNAVPNVTPYNITKETMQSLKQWYIEKGFMNSTANHQIWLLKCFLRWINQIDGMSIPESVLSYSTHLDVMPRTVTFLPYKDLLAFSEFEFKNSDGYRSRARDLWCFMAFTSLRYSDLKNLKKAHIVDGHIEMFTQKTAERITIPLVDGALAILDKYKDYENPEGYVFPVPSNQKLNEYIKEAAEEAGIDRPVIYVYMVGKERHETQKKFYEIISCHDGRRTFVSNSLAMGIPAEVVRKATGHRDYNTMKPYIDTALETQTIEMEKWNKSRYRSEILTLLDKANEDQLRDFLAMLKDVV